ncbi:putative transcriptional regulator [Rubidibacter lacunae KORDI 51-2]|uniref:Putative transcriptional regulator n=1 Tax=Rubidibacter lacunae KORDI 51-2 TaxID=582515 RepID=U5DN46_9CHRO|nr:BlaI/MecI/CopY family transcriptional regulator [Rubidibacter lacunae]ERN41095.1 putative transcriptional regulator [Rubidibacter lacunae KORDI 51-2]
MAPLPDRRPKRLVLGPLETEIMDITWELGIVTVKDVLQRILNDPERELTAPSVTTVLRRLTEKGWLQCDRSERAFRWQPAISRAHAKSLRAYEHLQNFLTVGTPDAISAFADELDRDSIEQLDAIARKLKAARRSHSGEI